MGWDEVRHGEKVSSTVPRSHDMTCGKNESPTNNDHLYRIVTKLDVSVS